MKVPSLSYHRIVRAFQRDGQAKHLPDETQKVTIPAHRPVKRSTLSHILETARLTVDGFLDLVQSTGNVGISRRGWDFIKYTAVIKQDGDWWIGWVEEIPGVNCQERSREELMETLTITLREALEFDR